MKNKIYWFGWFLMTLSIICGVIAAFAAIGYEAWTTMGYFIGVTFGSCAIAAGLMGIAGILENTENTTNCLKALCDNKNIEVKISTIINNGEESK